jgi:hypothetical protein
MTSSNESQRICQIFFFQGTSKANNKYYRDIGGSVSPTSSLLYSQLVTPFLFAFSITAFKNGLLTRYSTSKRIKSRKEKDIKESKSFFKKKEKLKKNPSQKWPTIICQTETT